MSEDMMRFLLNNGIAVVLSVVLGVVVWFLWRKVEKLERKLECSRSRECVRGGGIPRPCQLQHGQLSVQTPAKDESDEVPRQGFLSPILLVTLLLFAGCASSTRGRQLSRQTGVQNGQPVDLVTVMEVAEETSGGLDVGAMVSAALQASQGKILGALEKLKPEPLPEFPSAGAIAQAVAAQQPNKGTDWGAIGGGLVATILGALAAAKAREAQVTRREKEKIEEDRDLAYDKWRECERQLPPR